MSSASDFWSDDLAQKRVDAAISDETIFKLELLGQRRQNMSLKDEIDFSIETVATNLKFRNEFEKIKARPWSSPNQNKQEHLFNINVRLEEELRKCWSRLVVMEQSCGSNNDQRIPALSCVSRLKEAVQGNPDAESRLRTLVTGTKWENQV